MQDGRSYAFDRPGLEVWPSVGIAFADQPQTLQFSAGYGTPLVYKAWAPPPKVYSCMCCHKDVSGVGDKVGCFGRMDKDQMTKDVIASFDARCDLSHEAVSGVFVVSIRVQSYLLCILPYDAVV